MVFFYRELLLHSSNKSSKTSCGISKRSHLVKLRGHLFKGFIAADRQDVNQGNRCLLRSGLLALFQFLERLVLWGFFLLHLWPLLSSSKVLHETA